MEEKTKPKKIAVVHCDIVSEACPGVGCFKAFNERKSHFEALRREYSDDRLFHVRRLLGQESISSGKYPQKVWSGCRTPQFLYAYGIHLS